MKPLREHEFATLAHRRQHFITLYPRMVIVIFLMSLFIFSLSLTGCTPNGINDGGQGTTNVLLTQFEVAGTHVAPCLPITDTTYGSSLDNAFSFYRSIELSAAESYSLITRLYTGTTCTGTEVFAYNQIGTYTLGSLTSSGATEIIYAITSSTLTIFGGASSQSQFAAANTLVTNMNNYCTPSPNYATDVTFTSSFSGGIKCTSSILNLPEFPVNHEAYYDLITLNSTTNPTVFTVFQSASIFSMGQLTTFPASTTYSYAF